MENDDVLPYEPEPEICEWAFSKPTEMSTFFSGNLAWKYSVRVRCSKLTQALLGDVETYNLADGGSFFNSQPWDTPSFRARWNRLQDMTTPSWRRILVDGLGRNHTPQLKVYVIVLDVRCLACVDCPRDAQLDSNFVWVWQVGLTHHVSVTRLRKSSRSNSLINLIQ